MKIKTLNNEKYRSFRSELYNYDFRKSDGYFARWGKTFDDDPTFSPVGPEICDLEISVNGCKNACKFCYKSNSNDPAINMTFEQFKCIIDKMPSILQIAFGITGTQTNPDFIKMMEYCRSIGIIPNFTLSGLDATEDFITRSSQLIGAVAVSAYSTDKNVCYDTVKKYIDHGVSQTNIHCMISHETKDFVWEVVRDTQNDPRLTKLNALVLLSLKPKGRARNQFGVMPYEDFKEIVVYCLNNNIKLGFDSCTANRFVKVVKELDLGVKRTADILSSVESCESAGLFSSYINVHGDYYPCSFAEGVGDWKEGISVLKCEDFLKDVWYSDRLNIARKNALKYTDCNGCRTCFLYPEVTKI